MIKTLLLLKTLLVLLLFCGSANAQKKYKPKYLRVPDSKILDRASYTSETGWIDFREDKESIDPDKFFDEYGASIGLGKHYQMRKVKDETDEKQFRH